MRRADINKADTLDRRLKRVEAIFNRLCDRDSMTAHVHFPDAVYSGEESARATLMLSSENVRFLLKLEIDRLNRELVDLGVTP